MKRSPTRRRSLGLAVSAAGLLTLTLGGLLAADLRSRLGPSRLLIAPHAIAVTPDGTVVVGSPPFSEVHVYGPSGRPLRKWRVPADGGAFRLALAAADRLLVAPARTGTQLEYTLEGELIATIDDAEAYERIGAGHELSFTSLAGARYAIEGGQIVRSEAGQRRVLVDGFASHAQLTLQMARVVAVLLVGVIALIGGVLMTATRKPATRTHASGGR